METPSSSTCSSEIFTQSDTVEQDEKEQEMQSKDEVFSSTPSDNNLDTFVELHHPNEEQSTATPPVGSECSDCERLAKRNRVLKNQLITAKVKLRSSRLEVKKPKKHAKENRAALEVDPPANIVEENWDDKEDENDGGDSQHETTAEEPDFSSDGTYKTDTENDTASEQEEDANFSGNRVFIKDNNLRTQPKFLVFLTQLLVLFKFCHSCKADNPLVETKQVGTMAVITSTCTNTKCKRKDTVWKSQPNMPVW
ncbi:uncharacterized protein LOC141893240 isoform X2 [Acropora palmata]